MRISLTSSSVAILAALLTGCAAGSASAPAPLPSAAPYVAADVAFMRGMIAHHQQALDMTALVPDRSASRAVGRLGERIRASQLAEIAQMRRWLETRGEPLPAPSEGGHGGHSVGAPGMLSPAEMNRLAEAEGGEFDRLFLEYMIRHHEGAVVMVADLFASEAAGQEPDVFRLASEIDADQRAEIARMRQLLSTLQQES